jgi:hypothetical protein
MTEFACSAEEYDDITYLQTVGDGDEYTVVVGIVRGQDIRQHIVRHLDAAALGSFERDVEVALDRGEDLEPTIATWAEMQGEQ